MSTGSAAIEDLIAFSIESLPAMRLGDGIYCFERRAGDPGAYGRSLRYTLMVELGMERARTHGYDTRVEPAELDELVHALEPLAPLLLAPNDSPARGERSEAATSRLRVLPASP